MANENNEVGRHRKSLRALTGLTQEELAAAAGLSVPTVIDAESGADTLKVSSLQKLADACGVSLSRYAGPDVPAAAQR